MTHTRSTFAEGDPRRGPQRGSQRQTPSCCSLLRPVHVTIDTPLYFALSSMYSMSYSLISHRGKSAVSHLVLVMGLLLHFSLLYSEKALAR